MPELFSTLSDAGLSFLTVSTVVAVIRSRGDPWAISFVLFAYGNLLLLFHCLRALERVPPADPPRKAKLQRAVLLLATTLNITLTRQVSKVLPPPLSAAVWCLAFCVTTAGFYLFYFLRQ